MKTRYSNKIAAAAVVATCLLAPFATAEDENRGKRRGPPPEAIEACSGMEEGSICSFSGRRGDEVQGSCIVIPNDSETVACAPEGGPRSRSRR
ncbi:MAG: hypothetical protein AB8G18_10205 [Gammaproteobacteria bacterium]